MNLEEALEVQVGHLLAILDAEELRELGIREDAALEVGVKAVVRLHVGGDELGDIRLGALGLGRETHEDRELIGDRAHLEERVVRTTSLPGNLLLGSHVSGVLAATLLGVASLALDRLGCLERLVDSCADAGCYIRAESLEGILERREDRIGGADLNRGGISRGRDNGGRGGYGDSYLSLGRSLAGRLGINRGRGSGRSSGGGSGRLSGLLIGGHLV